MSQAMACDRRWKMRRLLTLTAVVIGVGIGAGVLKITGMTVAHPLIEDGLEAAVALVAILMISEAACASWHS